MRSRITGLFLAVILLAAAVPAALGCCLHPPDHGTPRAAVSHSVPAYSDDAVHGCVDRAAPTQNPYIESTTGGGGTPASARGADATTATATILPVTAARTVRRTALTADSTGPPLWLST